VTDTQLMQSIKEKWSTSILAAAGVSSVPAAFLAALIANESGGDANAKRFEKNVLATLWEVLLGRKANYGSIGRTDVVGYIADLPPGAIHAPSVLPADAFQRVDALATSWGLTQIMGYHVLEPDISLGSLENVKSGPGNLLGATRLLAQFAHRYQLDLATDFPPLFACWNTGAPDPAKTFDSHYVSNGLERMKLYAQLAANDTDPGT
jgi:hypothetical protein